MSKEKTLKEEPFQHQLELNHNFQLYEEQNQLTDELEQQVMITKINIAAASAASASTEASAASAQPITPGGIKQIFNDMEIRTADINAAVDYPQLFRGLSTFELDRMDSLNGMVNNKQGALIGKREPQQEELTDLLIQQQPIAIEVVGHGSGKTFNTLTTMKLEVFTVHHQENQINKENFTELPGERITKLFNYHFYYLTLIRL